MEQSPKTDDHAAAPAVTATIKQRIRGLLPLWLLQFRQNHLIRNPQKHYRNLSTKEIFTRIYEEGAWGRADESDQKYFSGSGSHDGAVTQAYIAAVTKFLSSFAEKQNVADLGCGDFTVGASIRHLCGTYIACDVVEPLINWNRRKYKDLNVSFRALDISEDDLPAADVAFVRQVLQHLSNAHIARAVPQLAAKYKYLVLTEHLPSAGGFTPNRDKPAGASVRSALNSGVVLTCPPFNLPAKHESVLCEVPEGGGIIRTTLYRLA